ncbi:erythropoietin isoform X2 [Astatotilapia calliptera]|uniref:erythropoietin isoform X2 n=1 Tax=Astatotilapia calliptera TaxID=8154 RepID=UPI000E415483|nr:erythropoietin isoform X2 [Astatotilapia calliptera]
MLQKTGRGLLALLLLVLDWTQPGLSSPLRPICDLRVLNHFIQEARDAEGAMKSCREGCGLSQSVTVPQTTVDFDVWEKKNAQEQAQEVQTGLWLLQQSLNTLQTSVTNTAMHSHIDNTIRNLLSINAVLRSLNIQVSWRSFPGSNSGITGQQLPSKHHCVVTVYMGKWSWSGAKMCNIWFTTKGDLALISDCCPFRPSLMSSISCGSGF